MHITNELIHNPGVNDMLQDMVDRAFTELRSGNRVNEPAGFYQQFPSRVFSPPRRPYASSFGPGPS